MGNNNKKYKIQIKCELNLVKIKSLYTFVAQ